MGFRGIRVRIRVRLGSALPHFDDLGLVAYYALDDLQLGLGLELELGSGSGLGLGFGLGFGFGFCLR